MGTSERHTKRSARALAGVLVADAIYNVVPSSRIDADLAHLQVPRGLRFVFATAKGSAGAGLLLVDHNPRLARFAARGLVLYFVLAIGAHIRIRDDLWRYGPAAALLVWSGLTVHRLSRSET